MSTTPLSSRVQLAFTLCLFGIISIGALKWALPPSDDFSTEPDRRRLESGPTVGRILPSPPKRHKAILGMPMDLSGDTHVPEDPNTPEEEVDTDFAWWYKPRDHYTESLQKPVTEEESRIANERDAWVDMPDPFCASYTPEDVSRCDPKVIPAQCCNY